jgi:formate hydrogenlyase subunit 3/multisubunit Na+/H+ antiporter MnhD subunit
MSNDLLAFGGLCWLVAAALGLAGAQVRLARAILGLGGVAAIAATLSALPGGTDTVSTPLGIDGLGSRFFLSPSALWLMGFGLPSAILAAWLGTPAKRQAQWIFGAAASLIGALGVFGMQDAATFLISWEIMSLGGAVMLLGENLGSDVGRPALFMLALLEAGAVALILAFVLLANQAGGLSFSDFATAMRALPQPQQYFVALLLLIGFGAKLGLLPFYEWFPGAYGSGSGATGAFLSGVILNAAFFSLSRCLLEWLPSSPGWSVSLPGIFVVAVAVASAILTALYAFQEEGWRELLSLSSAENGSIAVCLLGAALMFRQDGLGDLAGLAWTVALIHLAGHALAKGALFLTADGVYRQTGSYALVQSGLLQRSPWPFGLGALLAAMSLAAMPPQAGFVSEWYLFQTFFQGFHLASLASRLVAALAGAGLALTVAIALATFVKAFGIGLLGRERDTAKGAPWSNAIAVGLLGFLVLALAAGMPVWLSGLATAVSMTLSSNAPDAMRDGWLLVPLTSKFAFISPSKLVIVMPLLAILPIALLLLTSRRGVRAVAVWYGGASEAPPRAATTALTFSNALRTFYSFIYRPTVETEREIAKGSRQPYFIKRLSFSHDVAPIFGPYLFVPLIRIVNNVAKRFRLIQSGQLNFYLSLIGGLLVLILLISLF